MVYEPVWISGMVTPSVIGTLIRLLQPAVQGDVHGSSLPDPARADYYPKSNLLVCTRDGRTVQCRGVNPSTARFATTTLSSATTGVAHGFTYDWPDLWWLYMRAERGRDVTGMWGSCCRDKHTLRTPLVVP